MQLENGLFLENITLYRSTFPSSTSNLMIKCRLNTEVHLNIKVNSIIIEVIFV